MEIIYHTAFKHSWSWTIYGALSGAQWGPSVFLWITLGTILGGGVHDFSVGFLSMRHDGASVSELTGMYLGSLVKQIMRVFSVVLLVMVGAVFAVGPASLIAMLIGKQGVASGLLVNTNFWLIIILVYYFIATSSLLIRLSVKYIHCLVYV